MAKAKPVFIPGTNLEFKSGSAAAKALGINAANIYSVLKGRRKSAGGYQFGYTSNRVVYIPETGRTFESVQTAAKSVKVNPQKASRLIDNNIDKTVKGYHFTYADVTKVTPASDVESRPSTSARSKKSRRRKKQQHIQQHRQKKQAKVTRQHQKETERRQERTEASIRQQQRHDERQRKLKLRQYIDKYNTAKSELQEYLNKVNDKITEYYNSNPALIYYAATSPDVFGMQMIIGYTDDGHFDTSLSEFALSDNPTQKEIEDLTERLENIKKRMEMETGKKKGAFWNLNIAEQARRDLALEFFKVPGYEVEMDKYAHLIWDIINIIEESNSYPQLGSDLVYIAISDAMKGSVPEYKLSEFVDNLAGWMEYSSHDEDELDEIFIALSNSYEAPTGFSIWDEEDWLI